MLAGKFFIQRIFNKKFLGWGIPSSTLQFIMLIEVAYINWIRDWLPIMKTNFLVVRLHSSFLAVAVDVARLCRVCQPRPFTAVDVRVAVQALTHLVTDHVHQPLEHSLHTTLHLAGLSLVVWSRCYLSNQERIKLENIFLFLPCR